MDLKIYDIQKLEEKANLIRQDIIRTCFARSMKNFTARLQNLAFLTKSKT